MGIDRDGETPFQMRMGQPGFLLGSPSFWVPQKITRNPSGIPANP